MRVATEEMGEVAGFVLGDDRDDDDGTSDVDRHPRKKARDWKIRSRDRDPRMAIRPALTQLLKSLEIVPTQRMYLEGARFLRTRIHHLIDGTDADVDREGGKDDREDASYLPRHGRGCRGGDEASCRPARGVVRGGQEEGAFRRPP